MKKRKGEVIMTENDKAATIATSIPLKPPGIKGARQYYNTNKEAILKDLVELGEKAMRKRWGISLPTWRTSTKGVPKGLAIRWGVGITTSVKAKTNTGNVKPIVTKETSGLPPFPAFKDEWPMLTQIE